MLYFNINQESLITFKRSAGTWWEHPMAHYAKAHCHRVGPTAHLGLVPSKWPLGSSPRRKLPCMTQDAPGTARERWNVPFGPFYIRQLGYN